MKELKRFLKSPITLAALGTIAGGVLLGSLLANRDSVKNLPVIGQLVEDAAKGFDGQRANTKFLGIF